MTATQTTSLTCARCGKPAEAVFHLACANRPIVFRNLTAAWNFVYRATLPLTVVMGDALQYWIVTCREAGWLMRAGYELAPKAEHRPTAASSS